MQLTALAAVIGVILGLLLIFIPNQPKFNDIGRIVLHAALIALFLQLGAHTVRIP